MKIDLELEQVTEPNRLYLFSFMSVMLLTILGCWLTNARAQTLGFSIFLGCGLIALFTLRKFNKKRIQLHDLGLSFLAVAFCVALIGRDATTLYGLNILALLCIAIIAYARRFRPGFPNLPVIAWVTTPLRLIGNALASPLLNLMDLYRVALFRKRGQIWKNIFIGTLWALPLLYLFGALLVGADARYSAFIRHIFVWDFSYIGNHSGEFLICWVASAGLLHLGLAKQVDPEARAPQEINLHWNGVQIMVVLASLCLLFLSYLMVQSTYFFGDDDFVMNTRTLTYSSYAVRGFWELIWVAVGNIVLLATCNWAVRNEQIILRNWVAVLSYTLLALNVVLLSSAALRMTLYVQAYNLSPLRFYASTILFFVLITLGILAWRLHQKNLSLLTWDFMRLSLVFIMCLNVINPNGIIAHYNLRNSELTVDSDALLFNLGKDAVPALITHATTTPTEACKLKKRLMEHMSNTPNWRNWTWSDKRARIALERWKTGECSDIKEYWIQYW